MPLYDRNSLVKKREEIYSDIPINLDKHPVTKYLSRVTNEEAVKRSIKNLIFTRRGERFYDSRKGSTVEASLFQNFDDLTYITLRESIAEVINNYEPRAKLIDIITTPRRNGNEVAIKIIFSLVKFPNEQYSLDISIKRIR